MNQQIAEPWTIGKIYQFVGEDALSRWEALGQTDSDIHWAYGMEANALVEQGIPSMLVYVLASPPDPMRILKHRR